MFLDDSTGGWLGFAGRSECRSGQLLCRILRIAGEGAESTARSTPTTYLGLQVVDDRFIEWVAEHLPASGVGCVKDHGWIPALLAGHAIDGLNLGGITWDIGTPERYAAVNATTP